MQEREQDVVEALLSGQLTGSLAVGSLAGGSLAGAGCWGAARPRVRPRCWATRPPSSTPCLPFEVLPQEGGWPVYQGSTKRTRGRVLLLCEGASWQERCDSWREGSASWRWGCASWREGRASRPRGCDGEHLVAPVGSSSSS